MLTMLEKLAPATRDRLLAVADAVPGNLGAMMRSRFADMGGMSVPLAALGRLLLLAYSAGMHDAGDIAEQAFARDQNPAIQLHRHATTLREQAR